MIFRKLNKDENNGWQHFKSFLFNGKLSKRLSSDERKSITLSNNPECWDKSLDFVFEKGRWLFNGFGDVGCMD